MRSPAAAAVVPSLDHASHTDYEHVYEPSEDTFLMLDAVLKHAEGLARARPTLAVELGSVAAPALLRRRRPRVTPRVGQGPGLGRCMLSRRSPNAGTGPSSPSPSTSTATLASSPRSPRQTTKPALAQCVDARPRADVPPPAVMPHVQVAARVDAVCADMAKPMLARLAVRGLLAPLTAAAPVRCSHMTRIRYAPDAGRGGPPALQPPLRADAAGRGRLAVRARKPLYLPARAPGGCAAPAAPHHATAALVSLSRAATSLPRGRAETAGARSSTPSSRLCRCGPRLGARALPPTPCAYGQTLLAPGGTLFLVVVEENAPEEVIALLHEAGLEAEVRPLPEETERAAPTTLSVPRSERCRRGPGTSD